MTTKKPHHHGNLRAELIAAAIQLLERDGLSGLSLRKCAALAGVSHAAPAHHFGGLDGLIRAIGTWGFTQFADMMEAETANAVDTPEAKLKAILDGYLAFAQQHDAIFTLMFGTKMELELDADLAQAAARAYGALAQHCAPFVAPHQSARTTEILVWSLVHGYATLRQFGQVTPNGAVQDARFDDILTQLPNISTALARP